jgi:polyisoprenoid-binding protein YceI
MGRNVLTGTRRLLTGFAAAMALLVVIVTSAYSPAMAQESTPAASDTPSAADCDVEQAVADAPTVYTIDGEASTASYVAQEELASIGANEVTGTTNAIIGSILVGEDGVPLKCSNFAVDMRTLETDEAKRDNFLRTNTLESDTYPFATFVVASIEGLDGGLVDGETTTIQLVGDITLHGVTRSATWDADVTLDGDTLSGTATTTFVIADYEMEKPIVGPVVSIEDEVVLNVDISAPVDAGV